MRRALLLALTLLAASLLAGCSDDADRTAPGAEERDTDRDGLTDAIETAGWNVTVETPGGSLTLHVASSPLHPDTDGDGVTDFDEVGLMTDPRSADTDLDGLLDGKSLPATPELLAALPGGRGVPDPERPGWLLGEASLCQGYGSLSPSKWDSDRPRPDGVGDGDELRPYNVTAKGRTYAVASDPCLADTDGDGLDDGRERALGADATRRDTDGDGAVDATDVDPVADVGVHATVARVTLAEAPSADSTLRVTINVAGREESASRAAAAGANDVAVTLAHNVDDAMDPTGESLPVRVLVRVSLVDADGNATALDLGGESATLDLLFDLRAPAAGPVERSGADGSVRIAFERVTY